MKDLKIHNKEKGNLISIKPIANIHSDRQYLASIIISLLNLTKGCLYIEASRPNYNVNDIIEDLKRIFINNDSFKSNFFEVSFFCHEINDALLSILSEIWFAYEHTAYCFFVDDKIEFNVKRKAWYEITSRIDSFVMFRGIEEDVLWIGKSNGLEFNIESHGDGIFINKAFLRW